MKKYFVLLSALVCATHVNAQKGFYLAPSLGIGYTNSNPDFVSYLTRADYYMTKKGLFRPGAALAIGYQSGGWRVETGFHMFTTGFKVMHSSDGKFYQRGYRHLGMLLRAGRSLNPGSKLQVIPHAGILATTNSAGTTYRSSDAHILEKYYKSDYKKLSLWGTASCLVEYNINKRIKLNGGPSIAYTITRFQVPITTDVRHNMRNYAVHMNVGMMYRL